MCTFQTDYLMKKKEQAARGPDGHSTQGYSMADIISGTEMRAAILDELRQEVEAIREKHGTVPGLVTILVREKIRLPSVT